MATDNPEQARADNRGRFPETAAFVDQLRRAGVRAIVLYAEENGQTLGEPPKFDPQKIVIPFS